MFVALARLYLNKQTKNAILDLLPRRHTFTPPPLTLIKVVRFQVHS